MFTFPSSRTGAPRMPRLFGLLLVGALIAAIPALGLTAHASGVPGTTSSPTPTANTARPPCPPVAAAPVTAVTTTERAQPTFPIRAAFYYGWGATSTNFTPTYGKDDPC